MRRNANNTTYCWCANRSEWMGKPMKGFPVFYSLEQGGVRGLE